MTLRLLVLPCLVFSVGCRLNTGLDLPDDDAPIDPPDVIERYTWEQFQTDYIAASCAWYTRCSAQVGDIFPDRASCEGLLALNFVVGETNPAANGDPLLYRADLEAAAACVQAINVIGCNDAPPSLNTTEPCNLVFVGRLNDGECCDERGGCGPGLVCERGDPTTPGIGYCSAIGDPGETCTYQECAPPASCQRVGNSAYFQCAVSLALGPGEDCDTTFDCAPALSCQTPNTGGHSKCLLRGSAGDSCLPPELPCATGLYCTGESFNTRCSVAPGNAGQSCFADGDCGAGLVCVDVNGNYDACVLPRQAGQPCSDDPTETCADGLGCIDGLCGVYPVPKGAGDPCHPDGPRCPGIFGDEDSCRDSGAGFVCAAPARENEPCGGDLDIQCDFARGLACDPVSSTCRKLPVEGELCPDRFCFPFITLTCVGEGANGRCAPRKPNGAACTPVDDEDELIFTECLLFSFCLPDATSGGTTCQRIEDEGALQCE